MRLDLRNTTTVINGDSVSTGITEIWYDKQSKITRSDLLPLAVTRLICFSESGIILKNILRLMGNPQFTNR